MNKNQRNYQKNIKNSFLIKTFIKLAFLLTAINANANAIPLKISTKNACNLLETHGLKANTSWQKMTSIANNSNSWGCSNNNNTNSSAPINFSFLASGDAKEVQNIEIKAEIKDNNFIRLANKKLIDISEDVSKNLVGLSISNQLKEAINNGEDLSQEVGQSFIKFTQEKISGQKNGLVMIFKISTVSDLAVKNNNLQ